MTVKTFIDRPLLSIVISVFIVALGVIALTSLPVEKYPDIAPPAINVWASYPGASAETVQKSVVTPLEEAINGVEGMTYMKSSASNGSASFTVFFELGANADMAAVLAEQNIEASVGALGENSDNVFQYALRYTGRKTEISEFENLVITSLPTGEELRLKDVADIELGQSDYAFTNLLGGPHRPKCLA